MSIHKKWIIVKTHYHEMHHCCRKGTVSSVKLAEHTSIEENVIVSFLIDESFLAFFFFLVILHLIKIIDCKGSEISAKQAFITLFYMQGFTMLQNFLFQFQSKLNIKCDRGLCRAGCLKLCDVHSPALWFRTQYLFLFGNFKQQQQQKRIRFCFSSFQKTDKYQCSRAGVWWMEMRNRKM